MNAYLDLRNKELNIIPDTEREKKQIEDFIRIKGASLCINNEIKIGDKRLINNVGNLIDKLQSYPRDTLVGFQSEFSMSNLRIYEKPLVGSGYVENEIAIVFSELGRDH